MIRTALRYLPRFGHVLRTEGPLVLWRKVRRRLGATALMVPRPPDLLSIPEPLSPIRLPPQDRPLVSVIIPVYNQFRFTHHCLAALARDLGGPPFEAVVVDDGSEDGTRQLLCAYPGVRRVLNEQNLGFIASCNRGSAEARGDYLVFLNNDTQVQPGWLDALIGTFEERRDAGLVGSRLNLPRWAPTGGRGHSVCRRIRLELRAPGRSLQAPVQLSAGGGLLLRGGPGDS